MHGNLPGLEAILADIEARGWPDVICLGDLVGYGPFPNEVAALVRERGIPTLMGNYDQGIGFETGDCGCVYKTDEQRAEGVVSLAWTDEVASDRDARLPALARGPLRTRHAGRRAARRARQPAAHQRVPLRGSPGEGHGEDGRREPVSGHPLRPHARALRPGRPRGPSGESTLFVNVGSAGRPKDGDWRVCYAIVDPDGLGGGGPDDVGRPAGASAAVEFVRVAYDYERLVAGLAATPLITWTYAGPPRT